MRERNTTRTRTGRWAWLAGLLLLASGCDATPLPTPPSAVPAQMALTEDQPGRSTLSGTAGAFDPGGFQLRVTSAGVFAEVPVAADGSFSASLPAVRTGVFYLEDLTLSPDADVYLAAVTGVPASTSVMAADPGPDRDMDRSPDTIDCAPDDDRLGGRRCPAPDAGPMCTTEVCNGVDDDCDGMVDEGCSACTADSDCMPGETCVAGVCECGAMLDRCGTACVDLLTDSANCGMCGTACSAGMTCTGGVCM